MTKRSLEDFAEIASDWFWETDSDHRFTYLSQRVPNGGAFQSRNVMGKSPLKALNVNRFSPTWQALLDAVANRRAFRDFEYWIERDDAPDLWVRISGEPRYDDITGTFVGYRGTGRDFTEEKQAMARLEDANTALQQRNSQLIKARAALELSAHEDSLTQLLNRRAFDRDVQDLIACTDRYAGLLQIDLDHFKWVNDTLGHMAGDAVLKVAAARIKRAAKSYGTAYRVGGDEFIIILFDHISEKQAVQLGHKITSLMSHAIMIGRRAVVVGASVGVAVVSGPSVSAPDLIREADAALYDAKARGRNAVCRSNARLREELEKYTWIAADLPGAVHRRELVPYYQPQRDLHTNEIIGVEALVRWHHPDRGIVLPQEFLKVAAELAINDQIDRHMLQEGLAMVDRFAARGTALPALSVNTCQARLLDPRLITDVGCMWTNRACRLSLELLETISFDDCVDHPQLARTLDQLRAMGVRIETDDFGSARASITGLLKVMPHRLKIDKGLVQEAISAPEKHNILRAILDLARGLNIECIAEGAEDRHALEVLAWLGCTQVQGFAIARPMIETELWDFLAGERLAAPQSEQTAQSKTAGRYDLPQSA